MNFLSKLNWLFHRLRAMPADEIAGRVKAKIVDACVPLTKKSWEHFRLGAVDDAMALPSRESAPAQVCDSVRRDAARILEGKWLLLGWKKAEVSDPPVWSRDEVHGVAIPMSVKDYRHLDDGADARCAWEIARWSEMVRLAQDAWLNGELDSLRVAQRWMRDWLEKNPVGEGIHWTSPLEGALRLMNFCWIDALTRACGDAALIAEQDRIAQTLQHRSAQAIHHAPRLPSHLPSEEMVMQTLLLVPTILRKLPQHLRLEHSPNRLRIAQSFAQLRPSLRHHH